MTETLRAALDAADHAMHRADDTNHRKFCAAWLGTLVVAARAHLAATEQRATVAAIEAEAFRRGAEAERASLKFSLDARLNNVLCEMKEGWDDSVVGFNDAWDIVRKRFADKPLAAATATSPSVSGEGKS